MQSSVFENKITSLKTSKYTTNKYLTQEVPVPTISKNRLINKQVDEQKDHGIEESENRKMSIGRVTLSQNRVCKADSSNLNMDTKKPSMEK